MRFARFVALPCVRPSGLAVAVSVSLCVPRRQEDLPPTPLLLPLPLPCGVCGDVTMGRATGVGRCSGRLRGSKRRLWAGVGRCPSGSRKFAVKPVLHCGQKPGVHSRTETQRWPLGP